MRLTFNVGRKKVVADLNWKRDTADPAFFSAIIVFLLAILTLCLWKWTHPISAQINLTLAGYHLGWAMRSKICSKWHNQSYFNWMCDRGMRDILTVIDAERVAKGLKPLSEIFEHDH